MTPSVDTDEVNSHGDSDTGGAAVVDRRRVEKWLKRGTKFKMEERCFYQYLTSLSRSTYQNQLENLRTTSIGLFQFEQKS